MGDIARRELLSSLSRLYVNEDYSDLTISSRAKDYRVHKAIVCPRSKYFAQECRRESPETPNAALSLRNDDPQAVENVIQYLYHLDYPAARAPEVTNGSNGVHHPEVNGHEEPVADAASDGRAAETAEPVDGPLDEFLPIAATKSKNKRKKRKKSTPSDAAPVDGAPEALADEVPAEKWDEAVAAEEGSAHEAAGPPQGSLVIHAKVYQLSKKYGIEGLEALALDKFESEAGEHWATDDFLQATKIVYSTPNLDSDDRKMKDLVTEIVYVHPELLDRAETQKVIRGLDLGYDVLMRVRKQGGFHSEQSSLNGGGSV